jgi:hypothetical protein
MGSLEYLLFICAERARLDGNKPLANDLLTLASVSHEYVPISWDGDLPRVEPEAELTEMVGRFHRDYGALPHSPKARKRYAIRRRAIRHPLPSTSPSP